MSLYDLMKATQKDKPISKAEEKRLLAKKQKTKFKKPKAKKSKK